MADVTGPINSLPGSRHSVPEGTLCDDCGSNATIRIQGETDSFGCEMNDFCNACLAKNKARVKAHKEEEAICDWCKNRYKEKDIGPIRDSDEGLCGPVYYVCTACRQRQQAALEKEMDEMW